MLTLRSIITLLIIITANTTIHAATVSELEAKAKISMEAGKKIGAVALTPEIKNNLHKPTLTEKKNGVVIFSPSLNNTFTGVAPSAEEANRPLELTVAGNEIESTLVGIYGINEQSNLTLQVAKKLPRKLRKLKIEVLPVVMMPLGKRTRIQRSGNMSDVAASNTYLTQGMWLAESGSMDIPAGTSRSWLIRISAPTKAPKGTYKLQLELINQDGKTIATPTIKVNIHPFALVNAADEGYTFGTFGAGMDFSEAQFAQMKAHGLDAAQWFWGHYGMEITNINGKLKMDFKDMDRIVTNFKNAGMRGPLIPSLGNDCCGHYEREICKQFNLPMQPHVKRDKKIVKLAELNNPETDKLLTEGLRQLFDHAKAEQWPEIVVLPYDEPTERLMNEHRHMVKLFRDNFPDIRLYGCSMDEYNWAKMLLDTDIIVSNGSYGSIRKLTRENNKSSWFYGSVTARHGFSECRIKFGLEPYAFEPEGMFFWSYNYYTDDPYNEFNGTRPDSAWVLAWPPLKKGEPFVESLPYEGLREGTDDVRYWLTFNKLLKNKSTAKAKEISKKADALRNEIQKKRPTAIKAEKIRKQLSKWITELI